MLLSLHRIDNIFNPTYIVEIDFEKISDETDKIKLERQNIRNNHIVCFLRKLQNFYLVYLLIKFIKYVLFPRENFFHIVRHLGTP